MNPSSSEAPATKGLRLRAASQSDGRTLLGGWLSIPSPLVLETLATADLDYLCIDCQHGFVGPETLANLLQVASLLSVPTLVRVPRADGALIGYALDCGADGIIVPGVESSATAAAIATACRYAPVGERSRGGGRASMVGGPSKETENDSVLCFAMIETAKGLAAADEIASTVGIDGIYVGPNDLAISLGVDPTPSSTLEHGEHLTAVTRIRDVAKTAGRIAAIHAVDSAETARARVAAGFDLCTVFTEIGLLRGGAAQRVSAVTERPS